MSQFDALLKSHLQRTRRLFHLATVATPSHTMWSLQCKFTLRWQSASPLPCMAALTCISIVQTHPAVTFLLAFTFLTLAPIIYALEATIARFQHAIPAHSSSSSSSPRPPHRLWHRRTNSHTDASLWPAKKLPCSPPDFCVPLPWLSTPSPLVPSSRPSSCFPPQEPS